MTFQEYFTAKYIVDQAQSGALETLLTPQNLSEDRWREVILLTEGLLENADRFMEIFRGGIDDLIRSDKTLVKYLHWATNEVARIERDSLSEIPYHPSSIRLCYVCLGHTRAREVNLNLAFNLAHVFLRAHAHARARALKIELDFILVYALNIGLNLETVWEAEEVRQHRPKYVALFAQLVAQSEILNTQLYQALAALTVPAETADWQIFCQSLRDIMQTHRDIGLEWDLDDEQMARLNRYLAANQLLEECLKLARVSDRKAIEDGLLLPPDSAN